MTDTSDNENDALNLENDLLISGKLYFLLYF